HRGSRHPPSGLLRRRPCSAAGLSFFFQAEDGIRDDLVTGVQTCALPIFFILPLIRFWLAEQLEAKLPHQKQQDQNGSRLAPGRRSEERRVGKECRSRGGRGE